MDAKEERELLKQVDRHGWDLKNVHEILQRRDASVMDLVRDVTDVKNKQQLDHEAFNQYIVVAQKTQEALEKAAKSSLTIKQYYVGLGVLIVAVISTLLAVGH